MALNIKNDEVEALVAEVAALTGENKTTAVRRSLEERRDRLARQGPKAREGHLQRFLEREVYPRLPGDVRRRPITKAEREAILGYGPEGV